MWQSLDNVDQDSSACSPPGAVEDSYDQRSPMRA
jgi:hypothetical protein